MQVTVFGASGKVGRQVVERLLSDGHTVVAFVHQTNPFDDKPTVRTVRGSIDDLDAVKRAVQGSVAVISALGSWGTPTKSVVSTGTTNIVTAMQTTGVQRLITLTGAGAFYKQDRPGLLDKVTHLLLSLVAPKILNDGEAHLKTLEASSLDWTCVRSPVMTKQSKTEYRLTDALPSLLAIISRRAVVKCLVDQLTDTNFSQKAPVIRRG